MKGERDGEILGQLGRMHQMGRNEVVLSIFCTSLLAFSVFAHGPGDGGNRDGSGDEMHGFGDHHLEHNLILPQVVVGGNSTTTFMLFNLGNREQMPWVDNADLETRGDVLFIGTVQEEIGLVGMSYWLDNNPGVADMLIALDGGLGDSVEIQDRQEDHDHEHDDETEDEFEQAPHVYLHPRPIPGRSPGGACARTRGALNLVRAAVGCRLTPGGGPRPDPFDPGGRHRRRGSRAG